MSCPTPGCTETIPGAYPMYDHLGRLVYYCALHTGELEGIRDRKKALCDELEAVHRLYGVIGYHNAAQDGNPHKGCVICDLVALQTQQARALVQLTKREMEITGP